MWAEFWQIYDRAYGKTGITIHFIDEGVDTGDIVYQQQVPITVQTDPVMLRALNTIQILRDYPRVVELVLTGRFERQAQGPSSMRTFRARDLTAAHKRVLFQRLDLLPRSRSILDCTRHAHRRNS